MTVKKEVKYRIHKDKKSSSQFEKYSSWIIGKTGFFAFLKYELIILFTSNIPGALGLFLRAKFYPLLLKKCGKKVVFGTSVCLRHPHKIEIADNTVIDDYCLLDAKGITNKGISIGSDVFVGRHSIMSCKDGDIILEDKVNLGFNCEIFSGSRVKIGQDTLVAAYTYFIGGDHDFSDPSKKMAETISESKGIEIGENCWIGAGTFIQDGVKIEPHSVIGTGSVVTKSIPEYSIAYGVPAKVSKKRILRKDY